MTIRLRLTLWYTALLGATLILFSVIVYSVLASSLWMQVRWNLEQEAKEVKTYLGWQIERDIARMNSPQAFTLPSTQLFISTVGVQLVRPDGMVIARSSNLGNMMVPKSNHSLSEAGQGRDSLYRTVSSSGVPLLIYSTPLTNQRSTIGIIQMIQPVATIEGTLRQVERNLILGTGLSLVLAAIVGAVLARRALTPIQAITDTARRITRTQDLGERLTIDQDMSEVGQLAATFNDMLDQIQQLFNSQRRLTADVSHELRTPLTIVQGNVELLQRMMAQRPNHLLQKDQDEAIREVLGEVETETERMAKLINDLLLLAQADRGLELQLEAVEMDTLLLDIYRQTRRVADRRKGPDGLTVHLGSEDQALVWGDQERLRQMLLNLADNAVKYTPEGGTITLGLTQSNGWVQLYVQDTGMGISPEDQSQIFERFFRADKVRSRAQGGSGLGLSIVQWIVQAHHGRIEVESAVGQGSTFRVWLPAHQPNGFPDAEEPGQSFPYLSKTV